MKMKMSKKKLRLQLKEFVKGNIQMYKSKPK